MRLCFVAIALAAAVLPWPAGATATRFPMTPANRNALVIRHLPMVHRIARRVCGTSRITASWDRDDMRQAGAMGLIEAANEFDPDNGTPFAGYARSRIWGAMMDYQRAARDRPKRAEGQRRCEGVLRLSPTATLADARSERCRERAEASADAAAILMKLTGRHRSILQGHYIEGLSLKAIVGGSEARGSQCHKVALKYARVIAGPLEKIHVRRRGYRRPHRRTRPIAQ